MAAVPEVGPRLGPLGIGEILDAGIKVCVAHAGTLVRAVLVVVVPVQLVAAVVLLSTVDDPAFLNFTTTDTGLENPDAAFWAGQGVIALLTGFSYLLATGACFRAVAEAWLGHRPDWRESLRFAARRALALLWVSVLAVLGVMLGLVALVVPGIFLYVAWSVAYPVLFVEDLRGHRALGRSLRLVRGRWWPTCGALVVSFILAGVISSIFTFGVGLLAFFDDSLLSLVVFSTLGTIIASALTTPFQAAIVALLYFDLRVRNEGFDLEVLAQRLGSAPSADGPAPRPLTERLDDVPEEVRRQAPYWPPPPGWQPPRQEPSQGPQP